MSKIITVSGNIGRTTLSYFLAAELAKTHKVALVATEQKWSVYASIFPIKKKTFKTFVSIGKLLSQPVLSSALMFEQAYVCGNNLLMYSYSPEDSFRDYPALSEETVMSFYSMLQSMVDYIVVDMSNNNNLLDNIAIIRRKNDICVLSADYKGLLYARYASPQNIVVLLPISKYSSIGDIEAMMQGCKIYEMPYQKGLSVLYNGIDISDIHSTKYLRFVHRLVGEIS